MKALLLSFFLLRSARSGGESHALINVAPVSKDNFLPDEDMIKRLTMGMWNYFGIVPSKSTDSIDHLRTYYSLSLEKFRQNQPPSVQNREKLIKSIYTVLKRERRNHLQGIISDQMKNDMRNLVTFLGQLATSAVAQPELGPVDISEILKAPFLDIIEEENAKLKERVEVTAEFAYLTLQRGDASVDGMMKYTEFRLKRISSLVSAIEKINEKLFDEDSKMDDETLKSNNEKCSEIAKAISALSGKDSIPASKALQPLFNILISSREKSKQVGDKDKYNDWNALLFRKLLQILKNSNELTETLNPMKHYLKIFASPASQNAKNYKELLKKLYQTTNYAMFFDGNSADSNKRKLLAIDLINYSEPKESNNYDEIIVSPQDLANMVNQFEKLVDVSPEIMESNYIAPSLFSTPEEFSEALNDLNFVVTANNAIQTVNSFRLSSDPEKQKPKQFGLALDHFLDEKLADPTSNLEKNYVPIKLMNAKQNLADSNSLLSLKPQTQEAIEALKEEIDQPAFKEIKDSLLAIYSQKNPLTQKAIDDKNYVDQASGVMFPVSVLNESITILPEKQAEKSEAHHLFNFVVGSLPEQMLDYLMSIDDFEGEIRNGALNEFELKDRTYTFATVGRFDNPCAGSA